jgi:hypothetical protein
VTDEDAVTSLGGVERRGKESEAAATASSSLRLKLSLTRSARHLAEKVQHFEQGCQRGKNIPNSQKMNKMAIKNTNISRPSKIYPNREFWFENIPSGNTDFESRIFPQKSFLEFEKT